MVASPFSRCHCSGPREVGAAPASVVLDLGVHPTQPQLAEGFAAHTQSSAGLCCRDPDPVTSGCDWRRLVLHQASSLVVEVRDHTSCRSMSWRWASGCAMLATDRLPSAEAPLLMADSKPLELDQLRLENSRLIALLEAHGIAWRSTEQPRSEPTPDSAQPAASAPGSVQQKVACSGVCSAVVTTSTPCAGRAGPAGDRAMRRPARMNGSRGSARSHVWPAAIAATGSCCP
jgi:hypothetical protein